MRSPGFLGLPGPTGERAPAAHSGAASLTLGGQGLLVRGCSAPSRTSRDFLSAPSRDYPRVQLSQPYGLLAGAQGQSGSPISGTFPGLCLCTARGPDPGQERGWRPGHRRGLSVTPGRGGRGGGPRLLLSLGGGNADLWPSARWLLPLPRAEGHGRAAWARGRWPFEGAPPGRALAPAIPHRGRLPGSPGPVFSTPPETQSITLWKAGREGDWLPSLPRRCIHRVPWMLGRR